MVSEVIVLEEEPSNNLKIANEIEARPDAAQPRPKTLTAWG
jgi:hypothetical protein